MLTLEAIEAAARVIWNDRAEEFNDPKWDDLTREQRNRSVGLYVEHLATAVLTAAAPFIAAQAKAEALREAAKDAEYELDLVDEPKENAPSSWLRARAATIEGKSE